MRQALPPFLIFCSFITAPGQSWRWIRSPGGAGNETGHEVTVDSQDQAYMAGTFRGVFSPGGPGLPTFGGADVYLAATDREGVIRWAVSAGGALDDTVEDVITGAGRRILVTGTYWLNFKAGNREISAAPNPKGVFLASFSENGQLQWLNTINGSKLKQVSGMVTDARGNLYLAGFFEENLLVDTVVLRAKGQTDLFLLKFDSFGKLLWASHDGYSGDTRATALALTPEEELIVAGYFNDTTRIAGEIFTANTFDHDGFIARYDSRGRALWARKAGGVHDQDIIAAGVDRRGEIFLAGNLVGVMKLSEQLSIQSQSGNPDFFLLRYGPNGEPRMGRAMGGRLTEQATSLAFAGGQVLIGGFYQGQMNIDGQAFSTGSGLGSFLTAFDENARLQWKEDLPSPDAVYISDLAAGSAGAVFIVGSFQGRLNFDGLSVTSNGDFDPFLARLDLQVTSAGKLRDTLNGWRFFPNPAGRAVWIEGPGGVELKAELFDSLGRRIGEWDRVSLLELGNLVKGGYVLRVEDKEGRVGIGRLIVE